jgi:hypothetical protein
MTVVSCEVIQTLAAKIGEIPGVLVANPWTRVPIKQRVYVDLKKRNRQRCWDLGAGRRLIVHADGRMQWAGEWAGAMTRDWHSANRTWERIGQCVAEFFGASQKVPPSNNAELRAHPPTLPAADHGADRRMSET